MSSTKITTLSKPMPRSNAEAALAFAEAKKPEQAKPAASEKRAFFAPEGHRRLTINLPDDLHKRLRLAAVEQNTTATKIIEALLEQHLEVR